MRKLFLSLFFVALGAGLWTITSQSARFSSKKWDAKFDTVMRSTLNDLGISNKNILSSVHEVSQSAQGTWVTHKLTLGDISREQKDALETALEDHGATVEERHQNGKTQLLVKRGSRVYQEILLSPLP